MTAKSTLLADQQGEDCRQFECTNALTVEPDSLPGV